MAIAKVRATGLPKDDVQRVMDHYLVDETAACQALALAPASALLPKRGAGLDAGTAVASPDGVSIPSWLFFLSMGFGFGMVLGPAVMASTDTGARRLAEMAKRKIG